MAQEILEVLLLLVPTKDSNLEDNRFANNLLVRSSFWTTCIDILVTNKNILLCHAFWLRRWKSVYDEALTEKDIGLLFLKKTAKKNITRAETEKEIIPAYKTTTTYVINIKKFKTS